MQYLERGMPGWRSARSGVPLARTRLWTIMSARDGDSVSWTPPFIAILLFIFTTTSYRFGLGMPAMVVGVLGLFLQRESIRVPFPLVAFGAFLCWSYLCITHWEFRELTFDHL